MVFNTNHYQFCKDTIDSIIHSDDNQQIEISNRTHLKIEHFDQIISQKVQFFLSFKII